MEKLEESYASASDIIAKINEIVEEIEKLKFYVTVLRNHADAENNNA